MRTAASPVNDRISFRCDSLSSISVIFVASSSELNSPASSCLASGRKEIMPNVSGNIAEGIEVNRHPPDI